MGENIIEITTQKQATRLEDLEETIKM